MNRIQKVACIGTLALALSGCASVPHPKQNLLAEYNTSIALEQKDESVSYLEGRILKVQPSSIAYHHLEIDTSLSANHEFEYVIAEGKDGKLTTLIYPYSKAILEREATLTYHPLEGKVIDSETFIDAFIEKDKSFFANPNILIEAEGIIAKDGIKYK